MAKWSFEPQQPVAIIIVAWNSGEALRAAIDSALLQRPEELVVVDNHSTDNSVVALRKIYPTVQVVSLASNTGFAAACNIGVASTRARHVLFLNDDAVLEPDYVHKLLVALAHRPRAASAVGKLTYQDGEVRRIDSAGLRLDRFALRPTDRGQGEADVGQYDTPSTVFGPTGAAALYRRSALEAAGEGGFDAQLFAYYEDVDLAWRLGNLGYCHLYVPEAQATHARRGPFNKPVAIMQRAFVNRYTVWVKNESFWRFLLYMPVALAWEAGRVALMLRRDPKSTLTTLRAAPHAIWRGLKARRRLRAHLA